MTMNRKKTTALAMALVVASAIAVNAEPQRGGGGHGGGGYGGGGHGHMGRGGFGGGHAHGGFGRGHVHGGFGVGHAGPRFGSRHGFDGRHRFDGRFRGRGFFIGGGFFDPFWGAYYPYGLFPFAYYPYSAYAYSLTLDSDVKVKVIPKDAQVFVDGYYAGVADNFDGAFQHLPVTPGGHVITVYLDGYRTMSRSIYVQPGSTVTFSDRLEKLAPGEVSDPPSPPASPTISPVEPQAPPDQSGE